MNRNIYTFCVSLNQYSGLHSVLINLHQVLKGQFNAKVIGFCPYSQIHPQLGLKKDDYIKFRNPFILLNSIVITHERKILPLLQILKILLGGHLIIVYIHHSILYGHRWSSFFPKHIVTISDKCIHNLTDYFHVPLINITKIYNCVKDVYALRRVEKTFDRRRIKILYPAKIYDVKRQLSLVENLRKGLSDKIEIIFAGDGPDMERLKDLTREDARFKCIGFIGDIYSLYKEIDFVMLFSEYEGLSITLIEATMMATPIICNNVGGNGEIAKNGYNAIISNNWEELLTNLNNLEKISEDEYKKMGQNSRKIYLDLFTYEEFKHNYIEYFNFISNL